MNIKTMLVPCSQEGKTMEQSKDNPRLVEVEVAYSFTRSIDGRAFRFCAHPAVDTADYFVLSHYETGRSLGYCGVNEDVLEIDAEVRLDKVILDHGEPKLRRAIEQPQPTYNGCLTCNSTGWASVGGPCIRCGGSAKAMTSNEKRGGSQ